MKIHKRVIVRDKNGEESKEYDGLCNDRKDNDSGLPRVGVSIGSTVNMGNYQSLRVDVWCAEDIPTDADKTAHFMKLRKMLDEQLRSIAQDYTED